MPYLYESHLGGVYVTDEELEDIYCETCGDADWLIGFFETDEEYSELCRGYEDSKGYE